MLASLNWLRCSISLLVALTLITLVGTTTAGEHDALAQVRINLDSEDYEQARTLLEAEVQRDDPSTLGEAAYLLGLIFDEGLGVEPGLDPTLRWYRVSAEQGYAPGQYAFGTLYRNGRGLETDMTTAIEWFERAAAQDDPTALTALGELFERGMGVPIDVNKAITYYRRGAQAGSGAAQNALGVLYLIGKGVEKDRARAYAWFDAANTRGDLQAAANLEWLEPRLTDTERQRAADLEGQLFR